VPRGDSQHTPGRGGAAASAASSCHRKHMHKGRQPAHPDWGPRGCSCSGEREIYAQVGHGVQGALGCSCILHETTTLQLAAMQSRRWPPLGPHTLLRPPAAAPCHRSEVLQHVAVCHSHHAGGTVWSTHQLSQQARVHSSAPVMQPAGCANHPSTTTTTTATMPLGKSVNQTPPHVKGLAAVVVLWQRCC
jgi:hypothetical protein